MWLAVRRSHPPPSPPSLGCPDGRRGRAVTAGLAAAMQALPRRARKENVGVAAQRPALRSMGPRGGFGYGGDGGSQQNVVNISQLYGGGAFLCLLGAILCAYFTDASV